MLLPGTQRQTPTQAARTVAKQQETQAICGKQWKGGREGGGRNGGFLVVEKLVGGKGSGGEGKEGVCIKTHLTLVYSAVCVVIKRLCLSAGVRWVTRWRWDDAVRSHTLIS